MFFKKEGRPEPGELVVCTVKRILPHAAFVILDEYNNLEAMLHVSEVSSRWVRNIKEFVSEGKKVVCKVMEARHEEHIDVSLKRVTNVETKAKLDELKSEERMEKLIEAIAKMLKEDPQKSLQTIGKAIISEFGSLLDFTLSFKKEGPGVINEVKIDTKWKKELYKHIDEQIKSQFVLIHRDVELSSFEEDGLNRLKNVFKKAIDFVKGEKMAAEIKTLSAPKYRISLTAKNYKEAENFMEKLIAIMEDYSVKQKVEFALVGEK